MRTQTVPGMSVPDSIVERMRKAKDPKEESVNIVLEIIERIKKIEGISGLHIMAIGWEEIVPEVVKSAGLLPRPTLN